MDKLTAINGIGEKRAQSLKKLSIETIDDLLYYFPRGYEDRRSVVSLSDAPIGENVCIRAKVFSRVSETRVRKNMTIYSMIVNDEADTMRIIWYNNKYVKGAFREGEEYIFYGKIVINRGRRELVNPVYERADKQKFTGVVVPIYPLCEGITQTAMRSAIKAALEAKNNIPEYLPAEIREKYRLCELNFAIKNIHFPDSLNSYEIARRRFVFEEFFMMQLAIMRRRRSAANIKRAPFICTDYTEFALKLPYELTGAQKKVISEIAADFQSTTAMSRLVQGDVGSGKTAVAASAMYMAVKSGKQAVLMAPTEILAIQHFESFCGMFKDFNIKIVLLTSSSKEKKKTLQIIESGEADIIIGTHALIEDRVVFKNLGLAVTDEQHRFGVMQRNRLIEKGKACDVLVMTATPIPRTLALILYGDLKVSVIDELPPGRKPVKTYAVGENMRKRVYDFMAKNIREGMQAYVVCPLVEETEKSDLKNAVELCDKLSKSYEDFKVGLLHGRMKPREKEEVMADFVSKRINVLVATTVIEVGVNVVSSNIMIVENAERFGLSQLHQLRGRVGRGEKQAYCILIAHGNGEVIKKRMETMCVSNDGFYISEQDLKLRGPGDFFGTRQHGLPELKIADLIEDADVLYMAQNAAASVVSDDPQLEKEENAGLKERADKLLNKDIVMN